MKRILFFCLIFATFTFQGRAAEKAAEWAMNATVIEACSCPMFCQCYFNTKPAGHHEEGGKHFCKANNAYEINKGHWGKTNVDGAKFWITADLGGDFTKGFDWAILHFDKSLTPDQRVAVESLVKQMFPYPWKSFKTAEGVIDKWEFNNDSAVATLDGGKTAEVRLKRFQGMTNEPVVIKNLKYFAAARNDGFIMMPNEVEAYRVGDKAFEYKGTNGFMLTVDMNSNDVAKKTASK